MRVFGLIGHRLEHSFSERYFNDRIRREHIADTVYRNFPIGDISLLPQLMKGTPGLNGLNVTSPYKEAVISYLDELSAEAEKIGAVNCILRRGGKLYGYNTDCYGFKLSLEKFIGSRTSKVPEVSCLSCIAETQRAAALSEAPDTSTDVSGVSERPEVPGALILGSGGAAKAVRYVLNEVSIPCKIVTSRHHRTDCSHDDQILLKYEDLTPEIVASNLLIINATPRGMYPDIHDLSPFPYELLTPRHYLYDLIYNPSVTAFLKKGLSAGAAIKNGHEMLILQAEKSWELFGISEDWK